MRHSEQALSAANHCGKTQVQSWIPRLLKNTGRKWSNCLKLGAVKVVLEFKNEETQFTHHIGRAPAWSSFAASFHAYCLGAVDREVEERKKY